MGLGHNHHTNCLTALSTEKKDTLNSVVMHCRSLPGWLNLPYKFIFSPRIRHGSQGKTDICLNIVFVSNTHNSCTFSFAKFDLQLYILS